MPEDAGVWPLVTSTRDNCLGGDCPRYKDCFVMEARKQALAADVVVVNHHLFFADLALRDEGVAELLPACNTVIFDEAHQLPETASLFFGESVSTAQLLELARDTRLEAAAGAKDFAALPEAALALDRAARDLRLAAGEDSGRQTAQQAQSRGEFEQRLDAVAEKLAALGALLELQAERSEGLEQLLASLRRAGRQAVALARSRRRQGKDRVRWVEVFQHAVQLNSTPLSIADMFQRQIEGGARAWIFTSATLSVKRDFSHYQQQMGLAEARTAGWDSPFDYASQALLYVPERMPGPNSPGLHASRGRGGAAGGRGEPRARVPPVHQPARDARGARAAQGRLCRARAMTFPLLLQGEDSRTELLERFRRLGNAVLVASQSFWEGVDVRGEALSLVMIDRLPFAPPDDPVLAARIEQHQRRGAQRLHGVPAARGGDHAQAGRRPPDPRRNRPRRADDLRHAPGGSPLRPAHLAESAADATHAGARGGGGVFSGQRPSASRREASRRGSRFSGHGWPVGRAYSRASGRHASRSALA